MSTSSLSLKDALTTLGFVRITGLLLHGEHGHIQLFLPNARQAGIWGKSGECLVLCTNDRDVWINVYSKEIIDGTVFEKVIRPNINTKPSNDLVLEMIDLNRQSIRTSDLLHRQSNSDWVRV